MTTTRRKLLQIHLSTAVVLMFAAAVLLALNLVPERSPRNFRAAADSQIVTKKVSFYGWPTRVNAYAGAMRNDDQSPWTYVESTHVWVAEAIFGDAALALAILVGVWVACEWWIRARRREVEPAQGHGV